MDVTLQDIENMKTQPSSGFSTGELSFKKKPFYSFIKRTFDIVASIIGLLLCGVLFLVLMLVIVIDSPGASPIYKQKRVGKKGKEFVLYKFRTMCPNAEKMIDQLMDQNEMEGPVFKIKEDPRITRVGKFLRKTSLDELPQLWNVFKGNMSFVGPRPPLPREVKMYTDRQKQRLMVKPGITCYWQVQPKRNSLTFDEWLSLDFKYIEERNAWVDFKILIKTVGAVFGMEGE